METGSQKAISYKVLVFIIAILLAMVIFLFLQWFNHRNDTQTNDERYEKQQKKLDSLQNKYDQLAESDLYLDSLITNKASQITNIYPKYYVQIDSSKRVSTDRAISILSNAINKENGRRK